MGAKRRQVVLGALLPEALPGLVAAATVTAVALDERLDERGYIVPGLGDAGDRCFGTVA